MRYVTDPKDTPLQARHHAANCKLENVLSNLPTAGWREGKQVYVVDDARRRRLLDARSDVADAIYRCERTGELDETKHSESVALLERTDEILDSTREPLHVVAD